MTIDEKKSIWERNLNKLYSSVDNKDIGSLLRIIINENFGGRITKLYNIIDDDEKFSKIINEFSEKSIEFPNVDEFTTTIILTMVYYYKEVLGYSWKKIQELLPYERDISLRYGARIRTLKESIKRKMNKVPKNIEVEKELFEI